MSFPRYPKYKPSGVEWLGEVPEGWEVAPLKFVATYNDDVIDETTPPDTEILYVDISAVDALDGIKMKEPMLFGAAPSRARRRVKHGDTIVSTVRTYLRAIARVRTPEENLIVSTGFAVIRPRADLSPDYVGNVVSASYFIEQVIARSTGVGYPAINASDLARIPVAIPPLPEQTAIAEFLDRETGKIDGLVAEQRRLMELLKEKRQAVISHAVTKGLNPHAPMKPSGIEWLGDVPEHWEVGPVKRYFKSCNTRRIPLSGEERGGRSGVYPYYGASGIIDHIDEFIFDEDLVLVSEDGANLLNRASPIAFVAAGKYWVNNHAHILRPIDSNLLFWAARIESIDITPFVTGSAQPKFTSEALGALIISVPPAEQERVQIQNHILTETAKFDTLTAEAQRAIDFLQERRTALISAAVTGQIDVRQQTRN